MHTVVNGRCSQEGYGHDRRTNGGGANDLSVGHTSRGDHFWYAANMKLDWIPLDILVRD